MQIKTILGSTPKNLIFRLEGGTSGGGGIEYQTSSTYRAKLTREGNYLHGGTEADPNITLDADGFVDIYRPGEDGSGSAFRIYGDTLTGSTKVNTARLFDGGTLLLGSSDNSGTLSSANANIQLNADGTAKFAGRVDAGFTTNTGHSLSANNDSATLATIVAQNKNASGIIFEGRDNSGASAVQTSRINVDGSASFMSGSLLALQGAGAAPRFISYSSLNTVNLTSDLSLANASGLALFNLNNNTTNGALIQFKVRSGTGGNNFDGNWYAGAVQNGTANANNNFTNTDFIFANKRDNTASAESLRIKGNGAIQLPNGSPGIQFPAGTAGTGVTIDSNTLDDYEEGTWTPANTFMPITNNKQATYIKIGNLVNAWFDITYDDGVLDASHQHFWATSPSLRLINTFIMSTLGCITLTARL